jgi:hypothetical protein
MKTTTITSAQTALPDLARRANADAIAHADSDQRVVDQHQRLLHRRAHPVDELGGRRTRPALLAVDHDEVGRDAGLLHGLGDREPLPRMADRELEAGRLAAGQRAQQVDEAQLAFKQLAEPLGLMNPGKLRAWDERVLGIRGGQL